MRVSSIKATTQAGSGHPSSCLSAADLTAVLFFQEMRYDPSDPHNRANDRFVLSKGHAAPLLWAAYAEAGIVDESAPMTLRRFDSPLEGLCANVDETPSLTLISEQGGKEDNLCW